MRHEPIVDARRKEAEEHKAVALLKAGWNASAAARVVGVDPRTAQRWAHKHGIELTRYKAKYGRVDKDEALRMSDLEYNGERLFSRKEIAEMFGCSESYIKHLRRKRNLERKQNNDPRRPDQV